MENITGWNVIWKYEFLRASFSDSKPNFGFMRLRNIADNYLINFKDKLILDSTCGLGETTNYLKIMGFNVIGSDISETAIIISKNKFENTLFYESSWSDLPQNIAKKFDIIYNDCILWITDDGLLTNSLQGIFNSLNDNGQFIFFGINSNTNENTLSQKLIEKFALTPELETIWKILVDNKIIECSIKRTLFSNYIEVEFCYSTKFFNNIINEEKVILKELFKWTYDYVVRLMIIIGFKKIECKNINSDEIVIAYK